MGQVLKFKNADFSDNAVGLDKVYDTLKETDAPTPSYPLGNGMWINTIPFAAGVTIYAFSITLPSSVTYEQGDQAYVRVGVFHSENGPDADGYIAATVVGSIQNVDVSDLVAQVVAGEVALGTTHTIELNEPITVVSGDYIGVGYSPGLGDKQAMVYARTVVDGVHGHIQKVSEEKPVDFVVSNYNLANTFYGVFE